MKKRLIQDRTFVIADRIEGTLVSYKTIQRDFPQYIEQIKLADSQNKTYIQTPELGDVCLEIQWEYA